MSRPVDPRLLREVPAVRRLVVWLGVLSAVGAVLTVAQAVLLADVIVTVFRTSAGAATIAPELVALAAVAIGRATLAGAQEWLTARSSIEVRATLRRRTLEAVVRSGPAWADRQEPGRLVNATGPGLDALDGYVTRALPALVAAGVVPWVVLGWITYTDWPSGMILLVLLPLIPLFMVLIGITTKRLVERQYTVLGRLSGQFVDLLRGLTTLRVYGQAQAQERTIRRATEAFRRQTLSALRIAFLSGLVLDLIAALSVAVVAVDVGLRLDAGHLPFETALLVLLLAPELFAPLRAVGAQHHASQEGAAAISAALDVIEAAPAAVAGPAGDVPALTGHIAVHGLGVTYPERSRAALCDVSMVAHAGQVTVLTGRSGAGKSTLLATLLGFVVPSKGTVVLGTAGGPRSIEGVDLDRYRRSVAWLPQRPRPSQDTVGAEVRLGDPDASVADVAAACRACATPPPSTALEEDGRGVSAGQRRRIALARVLLRARAVRASGSVPIVLLDEPSEDLDAETEQVVVSVVESLAGWATVVIATHSETLTALADQQIRIEDGRVVGRETAEVVRPAGNGSVVALSSAEPTARTSAGTARSEPAAALRGPAFRLRTLAREAGATRRLALAAALAAATALTGLALTATSMWLISRAAQHPNVQALALAVVGVRTFAISRALLRYAERLVSHDGALTLLAALRVRVFAALRPLSPDALGAYGRGDLLRRFVGDVDGAQEGLVRAMVPAFGAGAGAVGAVVLASALAPAAGLVLGLGLVLAGIAVPMSAHRLAGRADALVATAGARDRRTAALLDALDEVHAYGRAGVAIEEVAAHDARLAGAARRPAAAAAAGAMSTGVLAAVTLPVVLAVAAQAVSAGHLAVTGVGVVAVCVMAGFEAVSALPSAFVAWGRCRAGLDRVAEVVSADPSMAEPPVPARAPVTGIGVEADAVSVAPASDAAVVLDGADLTLRPGEQMAIVGPSGCGKSTLLGAVLRLLPIEQGSLELTGTEGSVPLDRLRATDVPPLAAGSLQGDHVFDASLRDNLRVVRPSASDAELDAVARRVGLLGVVRALPQGWSTLAGPDGAALSGGQRQRLLLARALLADPAVLVLDEPTAHLDGETEQAVLDDLLDATAGRTLLMTTHRPSLEGRVDTVLAVRRGVLVVTTPSGDVRPQVHLVG